MADAGEQLDKYVSAKGCFGATDGINGLAKAIQGEAKIDGAMGAVTLVRDANTTWEEPTAKEGIAIDAYRTLMRMVSSALSYTAARVVYDNAATSVAPAPPESPYTHDEVGEMIRLMDERRDATPNASRYDDDHGDSLPPIGWA